MGILDRLRGNVHSGDRELIRLMRRGGEALDTRARETTHYLHFSSEAQANAAAANVPRDMFALEIAAPESNVVDWQVRAIHTILVNEKSITDARRILTPIAEAAGGYYDGWDTDADSALDAKQRVN